MIVGRGGMTAVSDLPQVMALLVCWLAAQIEEYEILMLWHEVVLSRR
jgi:hypothetical protein